MVLVIHWPCVFQASPDCSVRKTDSQSYRVWLSSYKLPHGDTFIGTPHEMPEHGYEAAKWISQGLY
jgi:hypothetical protein